MSEIVVSLLRVVFLLTLWWFVWQVVRIVRSDLQAPRDAKPLTPARTIRLPNPRPALRTKKSFTNIVITEGPLSGTVVPLGTSPILIGRAPDATIVLDDDFVSNQHTRLVPRESHWIVEDLGSTNGTWIDRDKVTTPTVLMPGAKLRIGRTCLELSS
ncbi:MAG: FHA domain-containing protein [Actinobacteria bacterium]|nr:FHA domain-containing protein [Actinomycetota bacterium]NBY15922.1 FHA domain-containing protein [Actinomycetota bacterium]